MAKPARHGRHSRFEPNNDAMKHNRTMPKQSMRIRVTIDLQLARFSNHRGSNYMEVIGALVVYFAIWTLVIWGSTYFNQNVR